MPYVELHCHSSFSFLDGASHPIELAATAADFGYPALAITDHDGLHGAMELAQATKPLGLRTIVGSELTLDDSSHITLLCEDRTGYANLCRLITKAHEGTRERPTEPEPPSVPLAEVELRVTLTVPNSEEIEVDRRVRVPYDPGIKVSSSELLFRSIILPEAVKETLSQRTLSVTVAGATTPAE